MNMDATTVVQRLRPYRELSGLVEPHSIEYFVRLHYRQLCEAQVLFRVGNRLLADPVAMCAVLGAMKPRGPGRPSKGRIYGVLDEED